jgi:hypothetical protein
MYFLVLKSCSSVSKVFNQGVYGQDLICSKGSSRLFIFAVFRMTVVHLVCGITCAILQILISIILCVHMCALLQLEKLLCTLQMVTSPPPFLVGGGGMTGKAVWSKIPPPPFFSFLFFSFLSSPPPHFISQIWTGGAVL